VIEEEEAASDVYVKRNSWSRRGGRLTIWPGMPFCTLPFPYLLHRWVTVSDHSRGGQSVFNGYWRKSKAQQWCDLVNNL